MLSRIRGSHGAGGAMTLGLVCDACDTLSALHSTVCSGCGETLGIRSSIPSSPSLQPPPAAAPRACKECGTPAPPGQKFCGECGARVGEPSLPSVPAVAKQPSGRTQFYAPNQSPGRAKLILIKGEGMDGVSYHLAGAEHVAGRLEGAILFPEDPLLSPRHANFFYRDNKLFVRDERSHNGIFIRIKGPVVLDPGSLFLVGEQLLRVETSSTDTMPTPDAEGTYFYGSPKRPAKMCLAQVLAGGEIGMVFRARSETVSVGREGNDVNFPNDPFISGRHAAVTALDGGRFQLADLGSRNGTFLRVRDEAPLYHGDYVFLGQQLLRVEIT